MKRRDFFKYGLGSTGLAFGGGLASNVNPISPTHNRNPHGHPGWVRKIDKPKLAVDDNVYSRFNSRKNVFGSFAKYYGMENLKELRQRSQEMTRRYYEEDRPGYRLEDRALADAAWVISRLGGLNRGTRSWTRMSISTPERRGVERYNKGPEEAARIIKSAARYFGAATVGITVLDRRHINSHERGKEIAFEPVEEPYENESKLVIPEKCKYAIALSVQMSLDNLQCSSTAISSAGSSLGYSRCEFLVAGLAEFIRGLGYIAIPSVNDLGSSVAVAVDAGLGELGRTNRLITPEFGPYVRLCKILTDLPLMTDKPIDFGLMEFCKVCKRCAEACPSKCLSFDDEPSFQVKGEWSNPGHQAWFEDSPKCLAYWQESTSGCSICIPVCPWAKKDKTMIHEIVKASSAKIHVLDRFFASMDEAFGYGRAKSAKKWWDLNLPEYGIDTSQAKG
ncbi:MAG: reductive dehalogenase [Candidatus Aminicenantes bacterium]|nr:MAG: reductive dehalogenase [Candidatus Aminicenantes bacterium]